MASHKAITPRCSPSFAHPLAHVLLGITNLGFGVSYRLVPMFALTHEKETFDRAVLVTTNSGVSDTMLPELRRTGLKIEGA